MKPFQSVVLAAAIAVAMSTGTRADSLTLIDTPTGTTTNAGVYSTSGLQTLAGGATATDGTVTGISLWNLLGGQDAGNTSATWGKITTVTPGGFNGKNSILRYYVLATGANGERSVVSLGEIAPRFGGTAANSASPAFIAFKNSSGLLSDPQLIVPNSTGRNIIDVQKLELLSVAALPNAPPTQSISVNLTGDVKNPGEYKVPDFQEFSPKTVTIPGTGMNPSVTYTGVSLFDFLDPLNPGKADSLVIMKGTDGYEVVHALGEFDPSLGGDPLNILAYLSSGNDFPGAGVARTIFPDDTDKKGRYMSNLYEIELIETPLPATWTMMLAGLAGLGFAKRRRAKQVANVG